MTHRVQKAEIGGRIGPAVNTAHQMVKMPTSILGNSLCADRAKPVLVLPYGQQFLVSLEIVSHFHGVAMLGRTQDSEKIGR